MHRERMPDSGTDAVLNYSYEIPNMKMGCLYIRQGDHHRELKEVGL
jgi:hypothetical protein